MNSQDAVPIAYESLDLQAILIGVSVYDKKRAETGLDYVDLPTVSTELLIVKEGLLRIGFQDSHIEFVYEPTYDTLDSVFL